MKLTLKLTLAASVLALNFAASVAVPQDQTLAPREDAIAAAKKGDYATALRLLKPLADQGDVVAEYVLGVMYDQGQGVAQNDAEAMKWYRLAADQGLAVAQFGLAAHYASGEGVPQNDAEVMKWLRLAADQGYDSAQFILGTKYAEGQGVPKDDVQAHMWFNLSAAQGDQGAVEYRDVVTKRMTPAQIAEAQKLARDWKPTTQPPR